MFFFGVYNKTHIFATKIQPNNKHKKMGLIKNYKCKNCDFVADDIYSGYGFNPFIEMKPMVCKDCGCVMSKPFDERILEILPEDSHCDNCNSEKLEKWNYKCPKCGSKMSTYGIMAFFD